MESPRRSPSHLPIYQVYQHHMLGTRFRTILFVYIAKLHIELTAAHLFALHLVSDGI